MTIEKHSESCVFTQLTNQPACWILTYLLLIIISYLKQITSLEIVTLALDYLGLYRPTTIKSTIIQYITKE